jgi:tetratricopeptide (TPR) repeat protein
VNHPLSVARLLSNLVAPLTECGRFPDAQAAYREARTILLNLGEDTAFYLLRLEQNYGWLLHNQGHYDTALETYDRAITLAVRLDQPIIVAELQVNRAFTLGMLGRLTEAETELLNSHTAAREQAQLLTVARIDMDVGELYAAQGRPADALRRLQEAQEQFAALGNRMEVGSVLLRTATLFERIGALREARRSYTQAHAQFEALQVQPQIGITLTRQATVSRKYGNYAEATSLLDKADRIWQALDHSLWRTIIRFERIALALAQNDVFTALALLHESLPIADNPALMAQRDILFADAQVLLWRLQGDTARRDEAGRAYHQVLSDARTHNDRWLQRQALAGLGQLALSDHPNSARDYLEAAVALDDMTRQTLSVEELKASFQAQAGDLLPLLARLAVIQDQPGKALEYAWRSKGSALLDLLRAKEEGSIVASNDHAEIEQVRHQLAAQRWQRALAATDALEDAQEHTDPAIQALEQRLYDLRRRNNRSMTRDSADLLSDPPELLGRMDAETLIEFLRCGDDLLAVRANRAGECRAVWLGACATMLDLLEELHLGFQNVLTQPLEHRVRHNARWLAECRPLLQRCYELLIIPLGDIPANTRLLIAPCDPLYLLPFAALWDGEHYLAERYELQITPSGALLAAPPRNATTGDPLVVAASAEGQLGAVALEALAVQAALPGSLGMVDDPRDLGYLARLAMPPQILHIAAHSDLRQDAPIFSALRLAGGLLSVEQCYDLHLAGTKLVILSGCTTATGMDTGGALLAFQSAFFVAGAHMVLSSLWPIDDAATAILMARFYTFLAGSSSPATALRATQQSLLDDPAYNHPAIWAAFICSCR